MQNESTEGGLVLVPVCMICHVTINVLCKPKAVMSTIKVRISHSVDKYVDFMHVGNV